MGYPSGNFPVSTSLPGAFTKERHQHIWFLHDSYDGGVEAEMILQASIPSLVTKKKARILFERQEAPTICPKTPHGFQFGKQLNRNDADLVGGFPPVSGSFSLTYNQYC